MEEPDRNRTKGRIVLVVLGIVAAIFIIASISSNLAIWRENDVFDADRQATEQGG